MLIAPCLIDEKSQILVGMCETASEERDCTGLSPSLPNVSVGFSVFVYKWQVALICYFQHYSWDLEVIPALWTFKTFPCFAVAMPQENNLFMHKAREWSGQ